MGVMLVKKTVWGKRRSCGGSSPRGPACLALFFGGKEGVAEVQEMRQYLAGVNQFQGDI